MSSKVVVGIMEEKAQKYWVASRQWRGDHLLGSPTTSEMLHSLAGLAGDLNHLGWRKAEDLTATLLDSVIHNRRNRKKKVPNNLIQLHNRRVVKIEGLQPVKDLQDLIGQQVIVHVQVQAG